MLWWWKTYATNFYNCNSSYSFVCCMAFFLKYWSAIIWGKAHDNLYLKEWWKRSRTQGICDRIVKGNEFLNNTKYIYKRLYGWLVGFMLYQQLKLNHGLYGVT